MRMLEAPLVYVGPTLSREAVSAALPGSILRPPLQRGDLYRDRLLRGSLFVVLDGVFHQQQAVSPREIIDVLADGALVVGASSMGALRAAECWPAGMRGVGMIYRLFRAGRLESDDEVAVTFDPADPLRSASVPLINVRYVLWRALRRRQLEVDAARQILGAARELYYADRRWSTILRAREASERDRLAPFIQAHDLKRADGLRALTRVARWLRADAELCRRPRRGVAFEASEASRERPHAAFEPGAEAVVKTELSRWLRGTGRSHGESENAEQLWAALRASGELDAELFRLRALREGAKRAREHGFDSEPIDRHQAEQRIAIEHAAPSWPALLASVASDSARSLLLECRDELALALAARRRS